MAILFDWYEDPKPSDKAGRPLKIKDTAPTSKI